MELEEIIKNLEQQLEDIKLNFLSLKQKFLSSLNINFNVHNQDFKCTIGYSNNSILFKIFDKNDIDPFWKQQVKIIVFTIDENLNFSIKQDFSSNLDSDNIKKYQYILSCFENISIDNFNFKKHYYNLKTLREHKTSINLQLEGKQILVKRKKFYAIKQKIDSVFEPIKFNESQNLFEKLVDKNNNNSSVEIVSFETYNNFQSLCFRRYKIDVDNSGYKQVIYKIDISRERKKRISKNELKGFLTTQFYYDGDLVIDFSKIRNLFNNYNPEFYDSIFDYFSFDTEDLYDFLKVHINANTF